MAEQIEIPDSFPGAGDVTGKRVVLTGASRGLGELLAHAFSQCRRPGGVGGPDGGRDLKAVADALPGPDPGRSAAM